MSVKSLEGVEDTDANGNDLTSITSGSDLDCAFYAYLMEPAVSAPGECMTQP